MENKNRFKKSFLIFFAVVLYFIPFNPENTGAQNQNNDPAYWYGRGMASMMREDWYSAAESFLECIRINPAHADGTAALADCYFELGEYDEALIWVRRARLLSRANNSLANLEASILTAQGFLDEASIIINEILVREPYNKEALFTAAELDIARGRSGDAVLRYREAVRRFPDDRRLLVSLALVLGSLGDTDAARSYIDRALVEHPSDFRVYYYASYLAAKENALNRAIEYARLSLNHRPNFAPALSLLASLRYRSGQFEEASNLADELIRINREDALAWHLKGISQIRLGRYSEAVNTLTSAVMIDGEDEFIRSALEELLISSTRLEDPQRDRWAAWHFSRARDYSSKNLTEQALFEYRRGLRLNPFSLERRGYAEILRTQGFPARYLEELKFMQELGLSRFESRAVKEITDAIENYSSLLGNALFRRWNVDPVNIVKPHWKIAVFSIAGQSTFFHTDAGASAASFVKELLVHERNIYPMDIETRQASFSDAFRAARESGADYFLLISVSENERDISINAELFTARTGSRVAVIEVFRTGQDRLKNSCRGVAEQLSQILPFRAELINRVQNQGLIDKGRADGVKDGDEFILVRKGSAAVANEGIGLVFAPGDISGKITITSADEEIAAGILEPDGFFDRIIPGDEVLVLPIMEENNAVNGGSIPLDPELRTLLRTLR